MRGFHLNFSSSHFLFLFLFLGLSVRTLGDDLCSTAFCGKGSCVPSGIGYSCTCDPGWKKTLGILDLHACVLPNCTIDIGCGSNAPPPPPPPPPPPLTIPPLFNWTNACFLVWCGEGTCLENGTKHSCECNAGSANILNLPDFPCLNKCSFGLDCGGILLTPPPNGTLASPPWSPPNGSDKISKGWSKGVVSLSTIILAWIIYQ